ncbi:hypothetical protein [Paraburkholderia caffeinilytica]|uniref:hypothetical protein n=1 Tax=Paraburkholderia caffeinilytica TaxID=1761016 RepID=UPI0038BBB8C8
MTRARGFVAPRKSVLDTQSFPFSGKLACEQKSERDVRNNVTVRFDLLLAKPITDLLSQSIWLARMRRASAFEGATMWSNDASENLIVSQSTSDVAATSICPTPDGGFYVSWFDNANGYSLYLQRLDVRGNAMWETNGKLIYQRNVYSTIKYGLSIDSDGNALIGIDSGIAALHVPGGQVLAFKVSPAGELLWGPTGITLSPPDESVSSVLCCGTSDGGAAFIWGKTEQEDLIRVTKLDSAGNPLWTASVARDTPDANLTPASIVASDNGSVIYAFVQAIDKMSGTYHSVLAQKLAAADGANLWGDAPVTVVDSSVATAITLPMGEMPTLIPDDAGGAVLGYPLADTALRIYVQRVTSTGQTSYAPNGVPVTGDQIEASAARFGFDPRTGRLYIMWNANVLEMSSVRAQCVDNAGTLLWDDAGIALMAYEPLALTSPVAMLPVPGGVMAAWIQPPPQGANLPQPLRVSMLDLNGAPVWQEPVVDVKTAATTTTTDPVGALSTTDYAAFAWTSDDNSVRAQNINPDGTLGIASLHQT